MRKLLKLVFACRPGMNEKGFTLVELLLMIVIISILISLAPLVSAQVKPLALVNINERYDVSNFFIQQKKDVNKAQIQYISTSKLCLMEELNSICYEKRGQRMNRLINNSGNNFGLLDVKEVRFQENSAGILVEIWKLNDSYYQTQLFRYKQ